MKYAHILSAFAAEPWAMQREKLDAITAFLIFKAEGGVYTPEEVARVTNKRAAEIVEASGSVAVVPVFGVLAQRMDMMMEMSGGMSYQGLRSAIHAAMASDDVKAIVLDIDSPGGAVPGGEELAAEIRALRGGPKPIIAQVNSLAASMAYWIASAADEIVVTPSGRAGSIGVYTSHDDISDYMRQKGIKRTYISAGKHKTEGNETEPMSDDTKAYVQGLVDESYARFVASVADGRGVTKSKVLDSFGQGRVFGAAGLIDRDMADRIATLEQTLARFGAATEPATVTKMKIANQTRAAEASALVENMRAGKPVTKREFENGMKGLHGFTNSEAERAARLYLKADQGDPDDLAEVAKAAEKLRRAIAGFKTP